jgi:uncharacterized protein (DUF1330 family)
MPVYVIGQISKIKDMDKWLDYKSKVKDTIELYRGKVLFRGQKCDSFIGQSDFVEIVTLEFESLEIAKKWYESEEYQAIASIREKGAEVTLEVYN